MPAKGTWIRDVGVAAYLRVKGFSLEKTVINQKDYHIYFVFSGDPEMIDLEVSRYLSYADESKVPARRLIDEYLTLRSYLISRAREQERKGGDLFG